jgi:hypothetical protein
MTSLYDSLFGSANPQYDNCKKDCERFKNKQQDYQSQDYRQQDYRQQDYQPQGYRQQDSQSQARREQLNRSNGDRNLSRYNTGGGKNKGRKRSKKMRGGYADNIALTGLAASAASISDIKSAEPLNIVGGKRRTKKCRRNKHTKSCKKRRR